MVSRKTSKSVKIFSLEIFRLYIATVHCVIFFLYASSLRHWSGYLSVTERVLLQTIAIRPALNYFSKPLGVRNSKWLLTLTPISFLALGRLDSALALG